MEPKQHRFHYRLFMFYIDLDELDILPQKLLLISRNRFNFFNFRDSDHLQLPADKPDTAKTVKQQLLHYLNSHGVNPVNPKIFLLTHLRTLGHLFNPVSFYFVYDGNQPLCCVPELGNTFGEMKLFLLNTDTLRENKFLSKVKKYFYVSPFINHDVYFDFQLGIPADKLNIRIDDYEGDRRFFISTLTGHRKEMTNARLILYSLRFPFITLKVIGLIHWNALLLWTKKIHYHKKTEYPELQKDVLRKYPQTR
jgi:uncharacterized protein